ncbi:MAG TPA: hypothetical protein PLR41_08140 [Alphaproteobacteria bacterium]|nr:hypothetical protein [Alphaproteobacteria bacterium]
MNFRKMRALRVHGGAPANGLKSSDPALLMGNAAPEAMTFAAESGTMSSKELWAVGRWGDIGG